MQIELAEKTGGRSTHMLRAGIYNRCSTEEEAQINALETQAAESREIVSSRGWLIAEQYIESESGTTSCKRSEYQRLLEDMETDKFDIVVIKSIDRLMRSAKDWYIFIDRLTQNKKQLYIYIDNKFYTPEDSLITGIKAILAEDFSRELSKKIKNAHKRRQQKKSGLNITSPMFGWDKVGKNEFVINEEEAASYRLAFALAREGKGFHSIAGIMYENGVRSKKGNRMDENQWRNMIYSCRAHGTVVLHTAEYDFEAKKRVKVPETEWIYVENALPPIVSKEYQMEVIRTLETRSRRTNVTKVYDEGRRVLCEKGQSAHMSGDNVRRAAAGRYTLSGKIYCAECGKVYYRVSFASGDGQLNEWKCSTMLHQGRKTADKPWGCSNINVLEDVVLEKIEESCRQHFDSLFHFEERISCEAVTADCEEKTADGAAICRDEEKIAEEALAMIRKVFRQKPYDRELVKLKKELDKLERKRNILIGKLADEVIEDADFKMAMQTISVDMEQAQKKISDIKMRTCEYNNYEERLRRIKEALYGGVVEKAKVRELVNKIDKIVIHPDNRMEIVFDKGKMTGLMQRYDKNIRPGVLDENDMQAEVSGEKETSERYQEEDFRIFAEYEHKTNSARKRERICRKILELFKENPDLMLKNVPAMVGMGETYVNASVRELKEKGLLRYERNGNTHTGRWVVNDKI